MSSSAIDFRDVRKTYRSRRGAEVNALNGISFQVGAGEIFGFAGPNGAGKSTAIKSLVGLVKPDSGSVAVFDHQAGTRPAKQLIGYLPEVTLYHEFMNPLELLKLHASLAGVASQDRESRCEEALERVGLWERRASRLSEFSKGMKQRFGIAQAIVARPKLLVLDELTSGLDPQAQASLLDLLVQLKEQGLTIFFSSHHLREIEKICDSVAIIHKGYLKVAGPMTEVLEEEALTRLQVQSQRQGLEELFHRLTTEQAEVPA